ncbi:uncharacterized protein LOC100902655 [Galendromus occidentalis]|uniref:Uncharacterized protein LOC100902655 n=1 Tax=Galendromus occidentalis TaxID=34638 RepID=A0AAJ6QXT6_9ACAR|nr:uncharacterized protein LOC100902655 [Galendromus occidentalis]
MKAKRRENPFPGRQWLRYRRKMLKKVFEEIRRRESTVVGTAREDVLPLDSNDSLSMNHFDSILQPRCEDAEPLVVIPHRGDPEGRRDMEDHGDRESGPEGLGSTSSEFPAEEEEVEPISDILTAQLDRIDLDPNPSEVARINPISDQPQRHNKGSDSLPILPESPELYFDDSTGLIEVVGVPKPRAAPDDLMIDVREQLETILAEWESLDKPRGAFGELI